MPDVASMLAIQLKDSSVNIDQLTPEMAAGVVRTFACFRAHGIPLVITSGNDGEHAAHSARHPRSLHYENRAVDVRLPSRFTNREATDATMKVALASLLGPAYDVVLEANHLHIEHDPK